MHKTVVFYRTEPLRNNFGIDNRQCGFMFYVVDSSFVGGPEEISQASNHRIKVGITFELQFGWGLYEASQEDVNKVLFYYAKKYIEEKVRAGTLQEFEDLCLSTVDHKESRCPLDISRIPNPEKHTFEVVTEDQVGQSLKECFQDFANYIQSEMRMTFWDLDKNQQKRKWKPSPEQLAKNLLLTFLNGRLGSSMYTFEEIRAGAGFIDVFIVSPRGENAVVELKMCGHGYSSSYALGGLDQLKHYMQNKKASSGYLIIFDSRVTEFSKGLQDTVMADGTTINVIVADLRPYVKQKDAPRDV